MSDGKIVFNTKLDNSNLEKDLATAKKRINKAMEDISKYENAKLPLTKQVEEYSHQLDEAKARLGELQEEMAAAQAATAPGSSAEDYMAGMERLPQLQAAVKEQEAEVAKIQGAWDKASQTLTDYDAKIKAANTIVSEQSEKARALSGQMTSFGAKTEAAMARGKTAAAAFGQKLLAIGKRVLVFSAIYAALRAVVSYTKKLLNTNEEYRNQLAQLKGALMTAFQPIYSFILPGVLAVLRVLTAIVSVVANVLSGLFGTTAKDSAKAAKNLNKEADAIGGVGSAAEEAKKSLANFDEINTLGNEEPSAGGGGGGSGGTGIEADFSAFDTAEYKAKIDELTVYLSGALLALGAILAFSGANIPLGIGLMAAGAIGLASVAKANWGAMSSELQKQITTVLVILGGAMLVIGAILAFSGISVVKGIALMAIGAAALAGAAAINWNTIVSALQGPIGVVAAIASAALLVLGIILVCSGVGLPLGISLIAAGAVGLVTVTAINWNAIQQKISGVWENIKQWFNTNVKPKLTLAYWQEKFNNIAEALAQKVKDGVNAAIAIMNRFIGWMNEKMTLTWSSFSVGGVQVIEAGSFKLLNIPSIPMLAKGAVLPANKPFLSVVGDQKNGTNIEAPLETIKQAVAEVMAGYDSGDTVIRFEGDLAQLARVLKPVIDKENKRVGGSLARGNV